MPSRRAALAGIAVVLALVVGVEAVKAGGTSTEEVLSVGVQPVYPVAPIVPGATACQRPLGVTESFDRVRFNVGTFGKPGPALLVSVVDQDSKQTLGWGRVVPGWVDNGTAKDVKVGTIRPGHLVAVCVRNEGSVRAYVYGDFYNGRFGTGPLGVTPTNTTNSADVDDVPMAGDESIALLRTNPPSLLARVPALFRHAAAFRPPFVGAWTFWLLAALALVGAPFALWAAVTRVADAEQPAEDGRYPDSPRP
jgi:hypothetical protein